jgi:hypothetical protein
VAGQNNYPKTVESAVTMLSHYMNDDLEFLESVFTTVCWTNKITLTKRTQGTENPNPRNREPGCIYTIEF